MMTKWQRCLGKLGIVIALVLGGTMGIFVKIAQAQILPDDTLGSEGSVVTPINPQVDRIDGGAIRGANLFHSFLDFNVGQGREAYFANPVAIQNIFSRVTGGNRSDILGTLGVLGDANLFLINPHGIIFGQNAALDIRGSFVASTASGVTFPDGSQFSATNPQAPPLLTVDVVAPISLRLAGNPSGGTIANAGNLAVGQDFTLSAGNLDLQGQLLAGRDLTLQAQNTVQVRDSEVTPFIAAAGGQLLVQGNQKVDIFALNHADSGLFSGGDMVLRSRNPVGGDAHYWTGGNFRIEQLDESLGGLHSPKDPVIRSLGDVTFNNYIGASLHILAGGKVDIGTVVITNPETGTAGVDFITEDIKLSNGEVISIDGSTNPTLDVRSGMKAAAVGSPDITSFDFPFDVFTDPTFSFLEQPPSTTDPATNADIRIGDVYIAAPDGVVFLTNQYQPNTSLPGGNIDITATGFYGDGIDTSRRIGNGGLVVIDSRKTITLNGSINTSSRFDNGGDINLIANSKIATGDINSDSVFSDSGNISLTSHDGGIDTTAGTLESSSLDGNGGTITLDGESQITTGDINSFSELSNSGNINLRSRNDAIDTTAGLLNSFSSLGNGGNITLDAKSNINTAEIRAYSNTLESGNINLSSSQGSIDTTLGILDVESLFGSGGDIHLDANGNITVGDIIAGVSFPFTPPNGINSGSLSGGDVILRSDADILLTNGAQVNVLAGNSGSITIDARNLTLAEGSKLQAGIESELGSALRSINSQAGNIEIKATGVINVTDDGEITNVVESGAVGQGGNINIETGSLFLTNGANLQASTGGRGDAGSITIRARDKVSLDGMDNNNQFSTAIASRVEAGAEGDAGNISIHVTNGSLFVTNGAALSTSTFGQGNAGSLTINARDNVSFNGSGQNGTSSSVFSTVEALAKGQGGDINIKARSFSLTDGAQLISSTLGGGDAGGVRITAREAVSLDGVGNDFDRQGRNRVSSGVFSTVEAGSVGNGGDIKVNVTDGSLSVTNGAQIQTSVREATDTLPGGRGEAGDITITTRDTVSFDGVGSNRFSSAAFSRVESGSVGNGGDIKIKTGLLSLTEGAQLDVSTFGQGNAGNLIVTARDAVVFEGVNSNDGRSSTAFSTVEAGAVGEGGDINIATKSLSVTNSAFLTASTFGEGNGGDIRINASDSVTLSGVFQEGAFSSGLKTTTEVGAGGQGGQINVSTGALRISDGAILSTRTRSDFRGGDIAVDVDTIELIGGGQLLTTAFGNGDAGNISVRADRITLSGSDPTFAERVARFGIQNVDNDGAASGLLARTDNAGAAGNVKIIAPQLTVQDEAQISASTSGTGKSGNIFVQNADSVSLSNNSSISTAVNAGAIVNATTAEQGGNIDIQSRTLSLTNGSQVTASTSGQGDAGNIFVQDANQVALADNSSISTAVNAGAIGQGGNVSVQTDSLSLDNIAQIRASTAGVGDAGDIIVKAQDTVSVTNGSSIASAAETGTPGDGGDIDIQSRLLSLTNNAQITASTQGLEQADAGKINLNADRITIHNNSQVSAATSAGLSGSIKVTANTFEATEGGQLSTTTTGNNQAGDITLEVSDDVTLTNNGSGVFANTDKDSTGKGGSITITHPRSINIQDGAQVAVNSQGTGEGGDIQIQANSLTLNNGSAISAETASNTGGNINLTARDLLLLRRGSEISTTAGTAAAGGDGGNITLDAADGFIVAVPQENSDIKANAFTGNGGQVDVTAQAIFGLEFRERLTPLSDITASSQFGLQGEVNINTPGIDPNRGLQTLPENPVDVEVNSGCQPGEGEASVEYYETGRSGSPQGLDEPLNSDRVIAPLIPSDSGETTTENQSQSEAETQLPEVSSQDAVSTTPDAKSTTRLIPACRRLE
jgi:filamentous hemagglutinin family protein